MNNYLIKNLSKLTNTQDLTIYIEEILETKEFPLWCSSSPIVLHTWTEKILQHGNILCGNSFAKLLQHYISTSKLDEVDCFVPLFLQLNNLVSLSSKWKMDDLVLNVSFWENVNELHSSILAANPSCFDSHFLEVISTFIESSIDPFVPHFLRQMRAKSLNNALEIASDEQKKLIRTTYLNCMEDLLAALANVGDYEVQTSLVEAVFRLSSSGERNRKVADWFPRLPISVQLLFPRIDDFEPDCRKFLNGYNNALSFSRKVFTYTCEKASLGGYVLRKPDVASYEQFWVDFNIGSKSISILFDRTKGSDEWPSTSNSQRHWETIIIYQHEVDSVTLLLEGKYCPKFSLNIGLAQDPVRLFVSPPSPRVAHLLQKEFILDFIRGRSGSLGWTELIDVCREIYGQKFKFISENFQDSDQSDSSNLLGNDKSGVASDHKIETPKRNLKASQSIEVVLVTSNADKSVEEICGNEAIENDAEISCSGSSTRKHMSNLNSSISNEDFLTASLKSNKNLSMVVSKTNQNSTSKELNSNVQSQNFEADNICKSQLNENGPSNLPESKTKYKSLDEILSESIFTPEDTDSLDVLVGTKTEHITPTVVLKTPQTQNIDVDYDQDIIPSSISQERHTTLLTLNIDSSVLADKKTIVESPLYFAECDGDEKGNSVGVILDTEEDILNKETTDDLTHNKIINQTLEHNIGKYEAKNDLKIQDMTRESSVSEHCKPINHDELERQLSILDSFHSEIPQTSKPVETLNTRALCGALEDSKISAHQNNSNTENVKNDTCSEELTEIYPTNSSKMKNKDSEFSVESIATGNENNIILEEHNVSNENFVHEKGINETGVCDIANTSTTCLKLRYSENEMAVVKWPLQKSNDNKNTALTIMQSTSNQEIKTSTPLRDDLSDVHHDVTTLVNPVPFPEENTENYIDCLFNTISPVRLTPKSGSLNVDKENNELLSHEKPSFKSKLENQANLEENTSSLIPSLSKEKLNEERINSLLKTPLKNSDVDNSNKGSVQNIATSVKKSIKNSGIQCSKSPFTPSELKSKKNNRSKKCLPEHYFRAQTPSDVSLKEKCSSKTKKKLFSPKSSRILDDSPNMDDSALYIQTAKLAKSHKISPLKNKEESFDSSTDMTHDESSKSNIRDKRKKYKLDSFKSKSIYSDFDSDSSEESNWIKKIRPSQYKPSYRTYPNKLAKRKKRNSSYLASDSDEEWMPTALKKKRKTVEYKSVYDSYSSSSGNDSLRLFMSPKKPKKTYSAKDKKFFTRSLAKKLRRSPVSLNFSSSGKKPFKNRGVGKNNSTKLSFAKNLDSTLYSPEVARNVSHNRESSLEDFNLDKIKLDSSKKRNRDSRDGRQNYHGKTKKSDLKDQSIVQADEESNARKRSRLSYEISGIKEVLEVVLPRTEMQNSSLQQDGIPKPPNNTPDTSYLHSDVILETQEQPQNHDLEIDQAPQPRFTYVALSGNSSSDTIVHKKKDKVTYHDYELFSPSFNEGLEKPVFIDQIQYNNSVSSPDCDYISENEIIPSRPHSDYTSSEDENHQKNPQKVQIKINRRKMKAFENDAFAKGSSSSQIKINKPQSSKKNLDTKFIDPENDFDIDVKTLSPLIPTNSDIMPRSSQETEYSPPEAFCDQSNSQSSVNCCFTAVRGVVDIPEVSENDEDEIVTAVNEHPPPKSSLLGFMSSVSKFIKDACTPKTSRKEILKTPAKQVGRCLFPSDHAQLPPSNSEMSDEGNAASNEEKICRIPVSTLTLLSDQLNEIAQQYAETSRKLIVISDVLKMLPQE